MPASNPRQSLLIINEWKFNNDQLNYGTSKQHLKWIIIVDTFVGEIKNCDFYLMILINERMLTFIFLKHLFKNI